MIDLSKMSKEQIIMAANRIGKSLAFSEAIKAHAKKIAAAQVLLGEDKLIMAGQATSKAMGGGIFKIEPITKALSIKQPWAWAIINKGKDIENRTWNTKFRGAFYVHAGKTIDKSAPSWLLKEFYKANLDGRDSASMGGIVGYVELTDVVTESKSKWFQGPIGFKIKNPMPMVFVPMKGQLGFFEVKL